MYIRILIILFIANIGLAQNYNSDIKIMQEPKKITFEKIFYTEIAVVSYGVAACWSPQLIKEFFAQY